MLIIPLIGLLSWYFYAKYFRKPVMELNNEVIPEKPVDYTGEARKMIAEAKKLFDLKREKDAYEKVSQAVRFYFSHRLDIRKELINSELLHQLKETHLHDKAKECLELCGLVEFAKYRANRTDFSKIIDIAENLISL
jgi:hypothetical protein